MQEEATTDVGKPCTWREDLEKHSGVLVGGRVVGSELPGAEQKVRSSLDNLAVKMQARADADIQKNAHVADNLTMQTFLDILGDGVDAELLEGGDSEIVRPMLKFSGVRREVGGGMVAGLACRVGDHVGRMASALRPVSDRKAGLEIAPDDGVPVLNEFLRVQGLPDNVHGGLAGGDVRCEVREDL